jgi:hypothetical protein
MIIPRESPRAALKSNYISSGEDDFLEGVIYRKLSAVTWLVSCTNPSKPGSLAMPVEVKIGTGSFPSLTIITIERYG